jgi:hypothetical protein
VTFKLNTGSGLPVPQVNGLTPEGLSALDRQGAAVQVYLKVNGVWQSDAVNLTNVPWAGICRDDPANNIEEMIVMFSNAAVTPAASTNYASLDPRDKPPQVYATDIGCRDWTATANLTRTSSGGTHETLVMGLATFKSLATSFTIGPGSEPTAYPTGAAGVNLFPINPGNFYNVSGAANWTYTPEPGSCYAGNSKQLTVGPLLTGMFLTQWMVDSPAYERGMSMPTLFATPTAQTPTMELPLIPSPDCKGPATQTVYLGIGIGTTLQNSAVRVGRGGLTITSPVSDVASADVTGTWSMTGATH